MPKDGVHSALPHLEEALKKQVQYTSKELGPLIDNRARRFRYALFRRFADIAPTEEDIQAETESRGYAIRRRLTAKGKRLTVEQEIKARARSAKFLAIEFITPSWKTRKDGQRLTAEARSRRGKKARIGQAIVNTAKGERSPFVRIQGFLEGARIQARERNILQKVETDQVRDIARYIVRKMDQRHRQFYNRLSQALIPVR